MSKAVILGDLTTYLGTDGPSKMGIMLGLFEPQPCGRRRSVRVYLRQAPEGGTSMPRIRWDKYQSLRGPYEVHGVIMSVATRGNGNLDFVIRPFETTPHRHFVQISDYDTDTWTLMTRLEDTLRGPKARFLVLKLSHPQTVVNLAAASGEERLVEGEEFEISLECVQRLDSHGRIFAFEGLDLDGYAFHGRIDLGQVVRELARLRVGLGSGTELAKRNDPVAQTKHPQWCNSFAGGVFLFHTLDDRPRYESYFELKNKHTLWF